MIITSQMKLEVGKTYNRGNTNGMRFNWLGEDIHDYHFYVLEKVTVEDYREYIRTEHPEFINQIAEGPYFYRVSVD